MCLLKGAFGRTIRSNKMMNQMATLGTVWLLSVWGLKLVCTFQATAWGSAFTFIHLRCDSLFSAPLWLSSNHARKQPEKPAFKALRSICSLKWDSSRDSALWQETPRLRILSLRNIHFQCWWKNAIWGSSFLGSLLIRLQNQRAAP